MYDEWRNVKPKPEYEAEYKELSEAIDRFNALTGPLNSPHIDLWGKPQEPDGVECSICHNKGYVMTMAFTAIGRPYDGYVTCKCMKQRSTIGRMRRSGLGDAIRRCTFDAFEVKEPWQQRMKNKAVKYVEQGAKDGHWLFIGGCPGCGKSHLCTAAVGKLVADYETVYAVWPRMAQELKAVVMDAEAYDAAVRKYQAADLLYIDDFFKPTNRGGKVTATDADVRIAFDIINARYINPKKLTVISSEWMLRELDDVDEATASRVYERCGEYMLNIRRVPERNHRYGKVEEI